MLEVFQKIEATIQSAIQSGGKLHNCSFGMANVQIVLDAAKRGVIGDMVNIQCVQLQSPPA